MDMKNKCVMGLCDRRHDKQIVTASYTNQMGRFPSWIMGNLHLWQARLCLLAKVTLNLSVMPSVLFYKCK